MKSNKRLLLGDEALALGAINAGLSGAYACREHHLQKCLNLYKATL